MAAGTSIDEFSTHFGLVAGYLERRWIEDCILEVSNLAVECVGELVVVDDQEEYQVVLVVEMVVVRDLNIMRWVLSCEDPTMR